MSSMDPDECQSWAYWAASIFAEQHAIERHAAAMARQQVMGGPSRAVRARASSERGRAQARETNRKRRERVDG